MEKSTNSYRFSNKLNETLNHKIKWYCVTKSEVYLGTNEDAVYKFDFNEKVSPQIALSKESIDKESAIVKELCDKKVIDLAHGDHHFVARVESGGIYCWGQNFLGQLGNGKYESNFRPEQNKFLKNRNIVDVSCGAGHSLALTKSGDVYAWGWNNMGQIGNGHSSHRHPTPFLVNKFWNEKAIAISCGFWHSMALTDANHIYVWGCNMWGQLGLLNENISPSPRIVEISGICFKQISCGYKHSLLLSNDDDLYVFGGDSWIGTNKFEWIHEKTKSCFKFIKIAAHYRYNESIALSEDNYYHIWEDFPQSIVLTPEKNAFKTLNEVFQTHFGISYKLIEGSSTFLDNFVKNGRYEILYNEIEPIGGGSFGTVFKAVLKRNNSTLAIKKITLKNEDECDYLREFNLFPIISQLDNIYVVKYFDVWFENNYNIIDGAKVYEDSLALYLSMELCELTLEDIIDDINNDINLKDKRSLTPMGYYFACQILIELIEGVNYLHNRKPAIIHRDLKPQNILMGKAISGKTVRIADFGSVAIHKFAEQSHTIDKGTPKYMAPEVVKGRKYDTKADIYSLGNIFEEMLYIDINK